MIKPKCEIQEDKTVQDSVMYRLFMTCDNPKGDVECGTFKKCRTGSQKMKRKTKSQGMAKKLDTSLANKPEKEEMILKGFTQKFCDPSSLQQLVEVSRRAQMLNNMIDSWFRGPSHDGRPEDIAEDLLKGTLDLQESLVMLRKLQEASQHMTYLKANQNETTQRGRIDAKTTNQAHSYQFSDQNYLMGFQRPWTSYDGSSCNCTEGLDSASEIPSTSSSQSSWVHTDRLFDSSFSSTALKKERGPNVVAKLMGLEKFSSKPFPAAVLKQLEGEKILNQKRPTFEIDKSKVRKIETIDKKVDPQRKKTLMREILETMRFKGLLKKSSVKEPKLQTHHFNHPNSKGFHDLPPIVLTKSRCSPYQESVEELSLRKLKVEALPSRTVKCKDGSSNVSKKMEEKYVNKRLKDVVKLDEKEMELMEKAPNMVKLCSHISRKPQLSEIDNKAKLKAIESKPAEKEISEPRIVARSEDQGESTSTELRTPQSVSRIYKSETYQVSTALDTISKTKTQQITNSKDQTKNQMKKQRPLPKPEAAKPVVEQLGHEEADKRIDIPHKDDCTEIRNITTVYEEPLIGHEVESVDPSGNMIGEDCKQSLSSSGDVRMLKSEHEGNGFHAEEAHEGSYCSETYSNIDKEGAELKQWLLTSQSFIAHAEKLLNLDVDYPLILKNYETDGIAANLRLYLDCANELTESKFLKASQTVRPFLPTCAGNLRLHISLGRLVEEIYNAIESLKVYTEISGQKLPEDNLFAMMERDINCNGLINGAWNWGWEHGFSAVEAEQVVNEVESLVLNGLIEEVIINL